MFNVFNIVQYSARNLATNVTNAAGQTGAAIFNNDNGLAITNNLRPRAARPCWERTSARTARPAIRATSSWAGSCT